MRIVAEVVIHSPPVNVSKGIMSVHHVRPFVHPSVHLDTSCYHDIS